MNYTEVLGTCKYCGQRITVQVNAYESVADKATKECNCRPTPTVKKKNWFIEYNEHVGYPQPSFAFQMTVSIISLILSIVAFFVAGFYGAKKAGKSITPEEESSATTEIIGDDAIDAPSHSQLPALGLKVTKRTPDSTRN